MKKEIIDHIKNFKKQGINVRVDEDQINDLINKISDIRNKDKDKRDKNINISYDKNKNKFSKEEITKSLDRLHNKLINFNEFNEEYNKFIHVVKFEYYKSKKEPGSVSRNQKNMRRYAKSLKDIVDLCNIKSGSDTSKKGKGIKILTNKQMLNRLPILLTQIQAGNNSKKFKNELRQILYSLYRSKVLTKTLYSNLIKSIRA